MDEKAKEIIEPFADWDIGGLKFRRVMSAIDAIVESKIEKLNNELDAKIQKLQIEKTFPPENNHDTEEEEEEKLEEYKNVENKFKRSIADILTKKFVSELNILTDSEYYNDVKWFINLPSYTTKTKTVSSSFHDYCRTLKRKLDILINSINNDPNSNTFYITRQKVDTNTIIPTTLIFNPKTCIINGDSPNENIKLTIIDDNFNKNIFKLKYHRGYSIIECDNGNPNFMLFDPVNCEYVLFYKSHKWLNATYDMKYFYYDDKEEVNDEKSRERRTKKFKDFLEDKERWDKIEKEGRLCYSDEVTEDKRTKTRNELKRKYGNAIGNAIASVTNEEEVNDEKPCEKSKKEPVHLWFCGAEVTEDKRIKTRNKLTELFGGVIMTITNEREVNDNFTYSNSDLKTLKKNIRKYIRNLICTNPEEPLYIYLNRNKQIEKPITCYHTRNYKIIPSSTSNNPWFDINIICENYDIIVPILFFDRSTYFLSVRNNDSENKSYNFAIVNTKTKEFVIFTKDKFVFDGWKLEITTER